MVWCILQKMNVGKLRDPFGDDPFIVL
jgi:hypothetical protein